MRSPWLCFWDNTQQEKQHSLNIYSKVAIQASLPVLVSFCLKQYIPDSCFKISHFTGAHIGPEPTTDRFVVVMVIN